MSQGELETGIRAIAHVVGQVAPIFLMCDPGDLSVWSELRATFTRLPTIFIYDRVPGGVGFSPRLFRLHRQLLASAGDLVTRCPCAHGCPACVGPREAGGTNAKLCAIRLLGVFLDEVGLPARR